MNLARSTLRSRRIRAALLALALAGEAACSGIATQNDAAPLPGDVPAPAADAAVRSTPVVPGRPARVASGEMATRTFEVRIAE